MSDPTPRDIFEAVGITPGQLYQDLLNLYPGLKRPGAARAESDWVIEAMEICETAVGEVYRHFHPEITQKETRKAQIQDEARKIYLAIDRVLKQHGIPLEQGIIHVLNDRYGFVNLKNLTWVIKALKRLGYWQYVNQPDPVERRPPWISQLHVEWFAPQWAKVRKRGKGVVK